LHIRSWACGVTLGQSLETRTGVEELGLAMAWAVSGHGTWWFIPARVSVNHLTIFRERNKVEFGKL
jgi:hypothetical protein